MMAHLAELSAATLALAAVALGVSLAALAGALLLLLCTDGREWQLTRRAVAQARRGEQPDEPWRVTRRIEPRPRSGLAVRCLPSDAAMRAIRRKPNPDLPSDLT